MTIIHCDYNNAFPSSIFFYKDRIETKKGYKDIFVRQLKIGNFKSVPKNKHLAQIFSQMRYSEEYGTGVENRFRYSNAYPESDKVVLEEDVFVTRVPLLGYSNNHIFRTCHRICFNP